MTRKSKKSSGHTPLTYYEMNTKFKSSQYGTTTARLSTDSQLPFGHCSLNLSPAIDDPVATPSGHIYSREAIVEYLLTKTQELKKAREEYEQYVSNEFAKEERTQEEKKETALVVFENSQKASKKRVRKTEDDDGDPPQPKKSALARTSYWLAEYQPEHQTKIPEPPPDRPVSPYSGNPLKRKDLLPLQMKRTAGEKTKVLCALSEKTISTQPVVALPSGHVILKDCYEKLVKPTMMNPFTSKKIRKEKYVVTLQKGQSGFASSGTVEAKKYRPTLT